MKQKIENSGMNEESTPSVVISSDAQAAAEAEKLAQAAAEAEKNKQIKSDIEAKKLAVTSEAEKKAVALQKIEASKTFATQLIADAKIREQIERELNKLFEKSSHIICLEKNGLLLDYKGSGLNFRVIHNINVVRNFVPLTIDGLKSLVHIALNVKGSPKFIKLLHKSGKTASIGAATSFCTLTKIDKKTALDSDGNKLFEVTENHIQKVFAHLKQIAVTNPMVYDIPATLNVPIFLEVFMKQGIEAGIEAVQKANFEAAKKTAEK